MFLMGVSRLAVLAQATPPTEAAAVAKVVESFRLALISADSTQLSNLVSDRLSYGHSSGIVQNKATFIHALTSGSSDFVSIETTEQSIQVTGTTAIVRHNLSATTNDGGKPGSVKLGILLVWQKNKAGWQLLARQAFKLPVN